MATKDKKVYVTAASNSSKIPIPLLQDEFQVSISKTSGDQRSYPMIVWKDMMQDWLTQEELWSVTDPDGKIDWTTANETKLKKNSKAVMSIRHALPVNLCKAVMRYKHANELWEALMQVTS